MSKNKAMIVQLEQNLMFEFDLYPESTSWDREAVFNEVNSPGVTTNALHYGGGKLWDKEFAVTIDGSDQEDEKYCQNCIFALESLTYPASGAEDETLFISPSEVKLVLEGRYMTGHITKVSTRISHLWSESGLPRVAEVTLTFKEKYIPGISNMLHQERLDAFASFSASERRKGTAYTSNMRVRK